MVWLHAHSVGLLPPSLKHRPSPQLRRPLAGAPSPNLTAVTLSPPCQSCSLVSAEGVQGVPRAPGSPREGISALWAGWVSRPFPASALGLASAGLPGVQRAARDQCAVPQAPGRAPGPATLQTTVFLHWPSRRNETANFSKCSLCLHFQGSHFPPRRYHVGVRQVPGWYLGPRSLPVVPWWRAWTLSPACTGGTSAPPWPAPRGLGVDLPGSHQTLMRDPW